MSAHTSAASDVHKFVLATEAPTSTQRRLALVVAAAIFATFGVTVTIGLTAPFARTQVPFNGHEASLRGSSYYDLPGILRWFTANIGVHHVHHLCSRIPYYRLQQTLRDNPNLRSVSRLTLFQSFRCVRLVLWDDSRRRLVSFRDVRTQRLS